MRDYSELKRLAEAAADESQHYLSRSLAVTALSSALSASTVLALIAENERLQREEKNDAIAYKAAIDRQEELRVERNLFKAESDAVIAERDQLKAKNEALHQDRVRYHRLRAMMISNSKFPIPNEEADKAVDALIAEEAARVFRGERP